MKLTNEDYEEIVDRIIGRLKKKKSFPVCSCCGELIDTSKEEFSGLCVGCISEPKNKIIRERLKKMFNKYLESQNTHKVKHKK